MRYQLSKKIVFHALEQEIKKKGAKVEIIPVTKIENIFHTIGTNIKSRNQEIFKNIKNSFKKNLTLGEYLLTENQIKIYLSSFEKTPSILYLYELIMTSYHEYFHRLTWEFLDHSYEEFFTLSIEEIIKQILVVEQGNEDEYYDEEIKANIYGIEKAESYFKHYPNIYNKMEGYIQNDKLRYQISFINYDIEQMLNFLSKLLKKNLDNTSLWKNVYPYSYISLLYTKEGIYKNLRELSSESEWNHMELSLKYKIVASKAYLEEQNLLNYTNEELGFILKGLEYVYELEKVRWDQNQKIKKEIMEFNEKIRPNLEHYIYLDFRWEKRDKRNNLKIKYLQQQIRKINNLIEKNISGLEFKKNKK